MLYFTFLCFIFKKENKGLNESAKLLYLQYQINKQQKTLQKHAVFHDRLLKLMCTDSELPADCLAFKEILNRKQLYFSVKDTKKLSPQVRSEPSQTSKVSGYLE